MERQLIQQEKHDADPQLNRDLHTLISNPVMLAQLADVKIPRGINDIPGLTMAFAPQKSYLKRDSLTNNGNGHLLFGGLEGFLGYWRCVGIRITKEGQEDSAFAEAKQALQGLQYEIPFHDKADVAIIYKKDIPLWDLFYRHVHKDKLLKNVGERVLGASGLDRQDRQVYGSQMLNFQTVIDANQPHFKKHGVTRFGADGELGLDMAFFGKGNLTVLVPVLHIKSAEVQGGILVEKVLGHPVEVPGFVIRKPWETKREAYERARNAKIKFSKRTGKKNVEIPVVSAGQNSLWRKMGFSVEMQNQVANASVQAKDLLKFLYLGTDNLHPGPLSKKGLSLPFSWADLGVDVLLVKRNPEDMKFKYTHIDSIYGYSKKRGFGSQEYELGRVDNVGGFIVVPDGWRSDTKILERIETTQKLLARYVQHNKEIRVVPVDSRLFREWIKNGSPFGANYKEVVSPKIESFGSKKIQGDSNNTTKDGTYLGILQQGTQIGGVQMMIAQRKSGETAYHVMDMGGVYAYTLQAYQDLLAKPTTASGLRQELEHQGVPMVPGIFHPEYILKTAIGLPGIDNPGNTSPVATYIRSELAHRFTQAELNDVFGQTKAFNILKLGRLDEEKYYAKGDHKLAKVTITHAHDDHDRNTFALDDVEFIMRRQTLALLKAKTERATTWRGQTLKISLISHPKDGASYIKRDRAVRVIDHNNQQIEVSPNMKESLILVGHSIMGTGAPFFTSKDGSFKSVLYTADIRNDAHGHTKEMVNQLAGKADIIIAESTNPPMTNKASVGVTEKDVKNSLSKIFKSDTKSPIIVLTPWHNIERVNSIIEVANTNKRRVALGYDHWEAIIQMAAEQSLAPEAQGFDFPYPAIGTDAALWARFATQPVSYQKTLLSLATQGRLGILGNKELISQPGEWVVVTSPSRLLKNDFNGGFWPNGTTVIYSAPFPYAINQKQQVVANRQWAEVDTGGKFIADFEKQKGSPVSPKMSRFGSLAASGHGTFEENAQLITDLLGGTYRGKEVVVIHGEHSAKYAYQLQEYIRKRIRPKNLTDLKITGVLKTYQPRSPLQYKGHWIKLD